MRQNMNILGNIEIRVARAQLVDALLKNKKKAAEEFVKATEVYNEDLKTRATSALEAILEGRYDESNVVQYNFGLKKPVDTQKNYDELITIFTSVKGVVTELDLKGDSVTMTVSQVNSVLNDEWEWAEAAKLSNTYYSTRSVK